MTDRLHPLVYATAVLCGLSLFAIVAPVWLGWVESSMPWEPWFTSYGESFFNGVGRGIVALFAISAVVVNFFRHEGAAYRVAVWGWGAVAVAALLALMIRTISNVLTAPFGL